MSSRGLFRAGGPVKWEGLSRMGRVLGGPCLSFRLPLQRTGRRVGEAAHLFCVLGPSLGDPLETLLGVVGQWGSSVGQEGSGVGQWGSGAVVWSSRATVWDSGVAGQRCVEKSGSGAEG